MRHFTTHPSAEPQRHPSRWAASESSCNTLCNAFTVATTDPSAEPSFLGAFEDSGVRVVPKPQWPTAEYEALLAERLEDGWIKVAFEDPDEYSGEGTHFLNQTGHAVHISEALIVTPDPRRYILRRARRKVLVETGETKRRAKQGEYCEDGKYFFLWMHDYESEAKYSIWREEVE